MSCARQAVIMIPEDEAPLFKSHIRLYVFSYSTDWYYLPFSNSYNYKASTLLFKKKIIFTTYNKPNKLRLFFVTRLEVPSL